jgi:hypothetical protein
VCIVNIIILDDFSRTSNWHIEEDSNAHKNALFGYYMQRLYGFKVLLVDALKLHSEICLFCLDHPYVYAICTHCSRFFNKYGCQK